VTDVMVVAELPLHAGPEPAEGIVAAIAESWRRAQSREQDGQKRA
jgi:hypothetical protein